MADSAATADRSPRCTYRGCAQPATYGVERAYMGPMVYCLEHMEEIARRKSSARTLRRVFKLTEPATSRPPRPGGDPHTSRTERVDAPCCSDKAQPSSAMLSSAGLSIASRVPFIAVAAR